MTLVEVIVSLLSGGVVYLACRVGHLTSQVRRLEERELPKTLAEAVGRESLT